MQVPVAVFAVTLVCERVKIDICPIKIDGVARETAEVRHAGVGRQKGWVIAVSRRAPVVFLSHMTPDLCVAGPRRRASAMRETHQPS
jgi:hypothetical protein